MRKNLRISLGLVSADAGQLLTDALVNSIDPGYLVEQSLAIQASDCTSFLQWVVTISEMGGVPQHCTYIGTYKEVRSVGVAANMLRRMRASSIGGRQSLDADK